MADRIRIETEQLSDLAIQMRRLSAMLDDMQHALRGVNIERESGSELKIELPSAMLNTIGRGIQSGEVGDCLNDLARCLGEVSRHAHGTAGRIARAAEQFSDTERKLLNLIDGVGGSQDMFAQACHVLNCSPDRSTWTPDMERTFRNLIANGQLMIDGGIGMLIQNGVSTLFGRTGVIATFAQCGRGEWSAARIYPQNSAHANPLPGMPGAEAGAARPARAPRTFGGMVGRCIGAWFDSAVVADVAAAAIEQASAAIAGASACAAGVNATLAYELCDSVALTIGEAF